MNGYSNKVDGLNRNNFINEGVSLNTSINRDVSKNFNLNMSQSKNDSSNLHEVSVLDSSQHINQEKNGSLFTQL
jgi:hypothetical protein